MLIDLSLRSLRTSVRFPDHASSDVLSSISLQPSFLKFRQAVLRFPISSAGGTARLHIKEFVHSVHDSIARLKQPTGRRIFELNYQGLQTESTPAGAFRINWVLTFHLVYSDR